MNPTSCPACGHPLAADDGYCGRCGQPVTVRRVPTTGAARPTGSGRGPVVLLVLAAVAVLAGAMTVMYLLRPLPLPAPPVPSSSATPSTPRPVSLLTDPSARPRANPSQVRVSGTSGGRACASADSSWEGYPGASCTFWQTPTGLQKGRELTKGSQTVACQADLGKENPVYRAGQENTWWLWVKTGDNSWDWYPETAITEGVSGKPVDGVALCVA